MARGATFRGMWESTASGSTLLTGVALATGQEGAIVWSPLGNHVYGLAMDGSNVWITTQQDGASRFDGTSWRTFVPAPGAAI